MSEDSVKDEFFTKLERLMSSMKLKDISDKIKVDKGTIRSWVKTKRTPHKKSRDAVVALFTEVFPSDADTTGSLATSNVVASPVEQPAPTPVPVPVPVADQPSANPEPAPDVPTP